MTRSLLAATLLLGALALADIPPPDSRDCREKSAGAACKTDRGQAGVCTSIEVTRPDYSTGVPPKMKKVSMLLCRAAADAGSATKSSVETTGPWTLAAAAALALVGTAAWRRRRLA